MQPIDLQTLFTQMDKVGKNQIMQKEGLQLQATMQQVQSQKKAEEHVQSVNEAQDLGYGIAQIKDENNRRENDRKQDAENKNNDESENAESDAAKYAFIRDPALGRNIDISG